MTFVLVFLGSGIGGALRHGVNTLAERFGGTSFPVSTLTVNIVGSFLIGMVAETFAQKAQLPANLRLFLATGLIGGFTTFSAFALDVVTLWERGRGLVAVTYVVVSVLVGVVALLAGMALIKALLKT